MFCLKSENRQIEDIQKRIITLSVRDTRLAGVSKGSLYL